MLLSKRALEWFIGRWAAMMPKFDAAWRIVA
jgi:hypothetical protein